MAFFASFNRCPSLDSDDDTRVSRKLLSGLLLTQMAFQIPTTAKHTEDGIPIRKIYVGNLPHETTRKELTELFASCGSIKACWIKRAPQNSNSFAFVTFADPVDAHKALKAPKSRYVLRGRSLRISPADSWHQPACDSDGNVIWNRKPPTLDEQITDAVQTDQASTSQASDNEESEPHYDILSILNHDCIRHIMSYVPLHDLVLSEAVSKGWRGTVLDYFYSIQTLQTSRWKPSSLTTNRLRQLLRRMPHLRTLHIDEYGVYLNDRTAPTIAKFCPQLETLMVENMVTKFWTPIVNNCENFSSISFHSCESLDDQSLISILGSDSSIVSLHLVKQEQVHGRFLTKVVPKLQQLTIDHCQDIKPSNIVKSIEKLKDLKYLCLDIFTTPIYSIIPELSKLTQLEELHLNCYNMSVCDVECVCDEMSEVIKCLPKLQCFSYVKNNCLHEKLLNQIAETCTKLTSLDVSNHCDAFSAKLKTMSGITAIVKNCTELRHLNVSYHERIPDILKVFSKCRTLTTLIARRHCNDDSINLCITNCHQLEVIDVSDSADVTIETVRSCISELEQRPRKMMLYVASTAITQYTSYPELPTHPLLTVECSEYKKHKSLPVFYEEMEETDSDLERFNEMFSDDEHSADSDYYNYYRNSDMSSEIDELEILFE